MKLCFIRHGEDKAFGDRKFDDLGLTFRGRCEVKKARSYYLKYNIKAIYCSPKLRTLQSAQIIAKFLKVPIYVREGLKDRFKLKYKPNSQEEKDWWKSYFSYSEKKDKYETCKEFIDRNFAVFDEIVKTHDDKDENILIVGHSANLYALAAYIFGIPKDKKIKWMRCATCSRIIFETHVDLSNEG